MMKRSAVTALAAAVFSINTQAAGFSVSEQSASQLGTALAGRGSNPVDASILSANPAGIAGMERQLTAGSALVLETGDFEGEYSANGDSGKDSDFHRNTVVPWGYMVTPINDKLTFGMASYGPFGVNVDYHSDFPGQYFGNKTSLKVVNFQSSLSYQLQPDLAIGGSIIASYATGKLTGKTWLPNPPFPAGTTAETTVEGDDYTFGWNVGLMWNATDQTTVGVAYHSKLDFEIAGDIELESDLLNYKHKGEVPLTLPERAVFSVTHQLDDRWTLMADATWTRWSRFAELTVDDKEGGTDSLVPVAWTNVWSYSIGASYKLNDAWTLRAGYMYDDSPVEDDNRTVRAPDSDRNWYTVGARWDVSDTMFMDFAYAYVDMEGGSIDEGKYNADGTENPAYGRLTGEYDSTGQVLAAQLTMKF